MADGKYVELVDCNLTGKETEGGVLIEVSTEPSFAKVNIWFPRKQIRLLDNGGVEISKWIEERKNKEDKVLVDMGEKLCTL